MPLVDFDAQAEFNTSYRIGAEPGGHPGSRQEVKLNYHRSVMRSASERIADGLISALNIQTTDNVVIVGVGFGWILEAFLARGFIGHIAGTDTSVYIQSAKTTSEDLDIRAAISAVGLDPDKGEGAILLTSLLDGGSRTTVAANILNESISTSQSRNAVSALFSGQPDFVISEMVLSSLSDGEAISLSDNMNAFNGQHTVAHLIVPIQPSSAQDSRYNWKTLEDWKLLIPGDTFIEAGTYREL